MTGAVMVINDFQAGARLAGWRDSLKWGIGVRPGMEPDQGAVMFARFVVGILIGFVAGFVEALGPRSGRIFQRRFYFS